eukprot:3642980-Prorocentrum_lima.AAC.1
MAKKLHKRSQRLGLSSLHLSTLLWTIKLSILHEVTFMLRRWQNPITKKAVLILQIILCCSLIKFLALYEISFRRDIDAVAAYRRSTVTLTGKISTTSIPMTLFLQQQIS